METWIRIWLISGSAVGAGAVLFFLLRLAAARPAPRDPATGELVLQCTPVVLWLMGGIAVLAPLGLAVLALFMGFEHPVQVWVPVGMSAFFLLLGGSMCLWAVKRRTRVSERGLTSEFVLLKPQFLAWDEVRKVDFASGQEFWVRGPGGRKALLMLWFVGVREAVPLLRRHLPAAVQDKDWAALDKFATATGAE